MVLTENTILVFIDHPTVLEITAHRLELLGLTVMRVGDPTDMQKSLEHTLPNAALIDLDFDSGEGLRWTEKLSTDECTSHIPIICISSRGDLTEADEAYRAGARSFLVSPFDPVTLERKLAELLQRSQGQPLSNLIEA